MRQDVAERVEAPARVPEHEGRWPNPAAELEARRRWFKSLHGQPPVPEARWAHPELPAIEHHVEDEPA